MVLLTHWCFSYCWAVITQHQDLHRFSAALAVSWLRWTRIWREGTEPTWTGHLTPNDQGLSLTVWQHVQEYNQHWSFKGGCCLETGWATVCWWEVVSDCLCITWWRLFSPSLIKPSLSRPTGFSHFCCSDSLPHVAGEVIKWLGRCLAAGPGQPTTFAQAHFMFYWVREQSQSVLHAAVGGHDPKHWYEVVHTLE